MAEQSQKSKDNNTEALHAVNKTIHIVGSRRAMVEMLLKKKSLEITVKTFY